MRTLTPPERRALRAKAHHLHPVVTVGQQGLTPTVLREIEISLCAHELIKIRVFNDDRDAREQILEKICGELDAASVQHLGKLLVIWRPPPPAAAASPTPEKHKSSTTKRPGQRRPGGVAAKDARAGVSGLQSRLRSREPAAGKKPDARRKPRSASAAKPAPLAGARRRRRTTA